MNATGVVPGGEFQPHNDILPVWRTDLDLWRNVMREYAEEFLGFQESMGRGGAIINYENDEPYRQFMVTG
jgi:agmatine/peptidylarginine deiminase